MWACMSSVGRLSTKQNMPITLPCQRHHVRHMQRLLLRTLDRHVDGPIAVGGDQLAQLPTAHRLDRAALDGEQLAGERMGTLTQVNVETVRNTVYLTGVVPTADDKKRAADLARGVNGVKDVVNNLQIRPQP